MCPVSFPLYIPQLMATYSIQQWRVLVQVDPKPVVFVQPPQGICIQQGLWMPSDGTPGGGWTESYYLEDGVFNPASWGGGLYNFTYNYTDSLGCTGRLEYKI